MDTVELEAITDAIREAACITAAATLLAAGRPQVTRTEAMVLARQLMHDYKQMQGPRSGRSSQ